MNPAANHSPLPKSAGKARLGIHCLVQRSVCLSFPAPGPATGFFNGLHLNSTRLAPIL